MAKRQDKSATDTQPTQSVAHEIPEDMRNAMRKFAIAQAHAEFWSEEIARLANAYFPETSVEAFGVTAPWSNGRGAYDWQGIAEEIDAPTTEFMVVDWKAAAEAKGVPKGVKEAYYMPGKPGRKVALKTYPEIRVKGKTVKK